MEPTDLIPGLGEHLEAFVESALSGDGDSDRHHLTLFALALASRGTRFLELGVRGGSTTLPLLLAAKMNGGHLTSVDIRPTSWECPQDLEGHWTFVASDALAFLRGWDSEDRLDLVYIDDWHAYPHVRAELALLDSCVGPGSLLLVHDLMYGGTEPFYHSDLTLPEGQWALGGPYRAVSELDQNFWEFSTVPWNNGLTLLRKKYSSKYHQR